MLRLFTPLFINGIIKYFDGTHSWQDAVYYAVLMIVSIALNSTMHHPYFLNSIKMGLCLKLANSGLIYKKVRRMTTILNNSSLTMTSIFVYYVYIEHRKGIKSEAEWS